jgi:predicted phosphodiesterase
MKIAVVSDIHGNLEAFQQVLADIEQAGIDRIISLGDNIGYGPDSEKVMALIRRRKIPSIMGNHEMALVDPSHLKWFNVLARESLQKTSRKLSDTSQRDIAEFPASLIANGCRFVHGFPPDQVATYLFEVSDQKLEQTLGALNERICFVGHTHKLEMIGFDGSRLSRSQLVQGATQLDPQHRYIINAGSVGQPRDATNHAKYVIWDAANDSLEVRFISYDYVSVAIKIITSGLPQVHADRLY